MLCPLYFEEYGDGDIERLRGCKTAVKRVGLGFYRNLSRPSKA